MTGSRARRLASCRRGCSCTGSDGHLFKS